MRQKSYVDFVDSGWPEPKIWVLENNVDYVAPKAQKLIFDNMCEKSYVDFVDSGLPQAQGCFCTGVCDATYFKYYGQTQAKQCSSNHLILGSKN